MSGFFCGPARNRTWIKGFGNPHTILCTTEPICGKDITTTPAENSAGVELNPWEYLNKF
jgi:hypothetical protein